MEENRLKLEIATLGECRIPSPITGRLWNSVLATTGQPPDLR